ncbi:MAG TPA: FAD-dependent monooxygenase [Solirubrobacteraceae bacterium]|nr:FAD-dependent monooxygenase [Solirubrobacteraceae bacterium]
MTEHAVVIAGAGPTGMMLAAELALAQVDVALLERRSDHVLAGSRAGGFHSRTIEVLDQRGVANRFLAEGQTAQAAMFATTVLDMSDFPRAIPTHLGSGRAKSSGSWLPGSPSCRCGSITKARVSGFSQDGTDVDVEMADGRSLRAQYLVGCDGGRSVVRKAAGIEFPGWDPTRSSLVAEVEVSEETPRGTRTDAIGA